MKDLLKNKTVLTFVILIALLITIPIVIFLGIEYLAPVVLISLMYLYVTKFKYENIVSPQEFAEMSQYLRELEEKAEIIREHLTKHDGDLDAKFELIEIDKEIEYIKKEMGL